VLYERFGADLGRVREEQRALYARHGYARLQPLRPYRAVRAAGRRLGLDPERRRFMNPQLDDVEAELTYLRIRALRPEVVVELGSFRGWSTTWILRALRDNGAGSLISFDLLTDAERFVPAELAARWTLVPGDVRRHLAAMPTRIDYLFVDADHGADFARWYLTELLPRVHGGVSVHDIYHRRDPSRDEGEAAVVLEWLRRRGIAWFTASRLAPTDSAAQIAAVRGRLDLGPPIHFGDHDSAIFFTLPTGTGP
jgi:predicted O-methyltransferase YrrM